MSEVADPATLEDIKGRIRRSPYPYVNEAMMRINGRLIQTEEYRACLEALLAGGYLQPHERGFLINRRLLPRVEVKSVLDIPLVSSVPIVRREAPAPVAPPARTVVVVRKSEPPPPQWELF
jgi:hypothetical protein